MASNIRRIGILVALTAVLLFGVLLVAASYTNVGVTAGIGTEEWLLSTPDLSAVPESVVNDATVMAMELFGDYQEKYGDFTNQLLATYAEAKDKDFVVIFNSGGWGWNVPDRSPGWKSIITGIELELDSLGYDSLLLNYQRTDENLRGVVDEFMEVIDVYPSKAENLACRVEFLTAHIPDLKVIVAGESNGTVISDGAMSILQDNPQVYSIQTGPPFWHKSIMLDRTLVLNDNGMIPDSFSRGEIGTMAWASLKDLIGLPQPERESGRILFFVRAPGHDYRWQYPNVCSQITNFMKQNFGIKPS
ncbi:MAG TPA: hypothetical protein VMW00_05525 [Dehalococcoidales bacterium]|nr:hypothetical protein [Dehalococcoidales bacterium]